MHTSTPKPTRTFGQPVKLKTVSQRPILREWFIDIKDERTARIATANGGYRIERDPAQRIRFANHPAFVATVAGKELVTA